MRRLPGLALPLLVLCCAPARAPAPAPASTPASAPAPGLTLEQTIDHASARRESAALLPLIHADAPGTRELVAALGRVGDPPAIARLIELLADPSLRVPAASALGIAAALGSELDDAEAAVLAAWSAADTTQRTAIAPALGRLGTVAATPVLASALSDPDPQLAAAAALALGVLGRRGVAWDPAAQPAAIALAERQSLATAQPAAIALAERHSVPTAQPVANAQPSASASLNPDLTHAAAYALAHAPPVDPREPADQALLRLAAAADPETRALALVGLTRRKTPAARTRASFAAALTDPSPWVRVAAVRGLMALADDDAISMTLAWTRTRLDVLADPGRAAAAHPVLEALERLATTPVPPGPRPRWRPLVHAAQIEAEALLARAPTHALLARAACQLAAAAAHDPRWRPPLRCAGDRDIGPERDVIEAGVIAAGFGGDASLPRLKQLFASTDPRVRAAAVTAAGALWPAAEVEAMWRTALVDPSGAVAGATADAIAALFAKTPTATLSPQLLADLVERARRELLAEVELYASLTAALAATGRREGLFICQAGLRLPSPTVRKAARDCVTKLAGDPGPQTPTSPPPIPPHDPASVRRKQVHWRLTTDHGVLEIDLDPAVAPWHVAALVALTQAGFYDGLQFHRVVPGFVVQGGDPQGTGWGGPGFTLPSEPSDAPFTRGAVGIADAGKDSGGSQFFLMHTRAPHLEGRYTRVGELRRGFEALDALQVGDRILRAEVTLQ
jgi:cyclophilin family peptidyl-prolyl cis-trans isomerase/HEAT repeat protein